MSDEIYSKGDYPCRIRVSNTGGKTTADALKHLGWTRRKLTYLMQTLWKGDTTGKKRLAFADGTVVLFKVVDGVGLIDIQVPEVKAEEAPKKKEYPRKLVRGYFVPIIEIFDRSDFDNYTFPFGNLVGVLVTDNTFGPEYFYIDNSTVLDEPTEKLFYQRTLHNIKEDVDWRLRIEGLREYEYMPWGIITTGSVPMNWPYFPAPAGDYTGGQWIKLNDAIIVNSVNTWSIRVVEVGYFQVQITYVWDGQNNALQNYTRGSRYNYTGMVTTDPTVWGFIYNRITYQGTSLVADRDASTGSAFTYSGSTVNDIVFNASGDEVVIYTETIPFTGPATGGLDVNYYPRPAIALLGAHCIRIFNGGSAGSPYPVYVYGIRKYRYEGSPFGINQRAAYGIIYKKDDGTLYHKASPEFEYLYEEGENAAWNDQHHYLPEHCIPASKDPSTKFGTGWIRVGWRSELLTSETGG